MFWKPILVEEQNKSSKKTWGYDIEKIRVLYLLFIFIKLKEKTHRKKINLFFSIYVFKSEVRHVLNSSIHTQIQQYSNFLCVGILVLTKFSFRFFFQLK